MLNNFIYAQTKDLFLEQLNAGNILDEAIVFIEDTKEIWNHGTYFGGGSGSEIDSELLSEIQTAVAQLESNKLDKTDAESTYAKKTELPDISGYITKTTADGLYATIGATQSLQEEIDDLETIVAGKADSSVLSGYATTGALTGVSDRVADIEGLIATDSDAVIDKWDEVVTFLDGISASNDLEGLLAAKANSQTVTDLATTVSNLTTTNVAEGNNLYFTDSRARSAITGGASTIAGSNLTASRALISNSSGKVAVSDITSTELSYLDGVTSNIQTQLNGKASSDLATTVNTMKTKLDGITDSADAVSFSRNLTSGTKIGTITINGTGTDLYCQTNTDTNTWRGITDSVSTTDSTISGSATAVKTAYDKAVSAYNLANGKTSNTGTVTSITVKGSNGISGSGTITTSGTITISGAAASTSAVGVVQLSSATNSTSETLAATPKAVKAAYDLAASKTANTGTVTSVAMTVPTGLSISGSPITTSGTLALSLASGYSIPTTAKQSNWDTAYGWGNHASAGYKTTDTKNTAGSTNSTSKLFLIGATSQAANPVTYSNSGVYATSGTMYATAYYETSDERLKNFKEDIKVDFDKLKLIPKKYFTWKNDKTQMIQIGTSAQAVQAIYPELVSNDTILHVDYAKLVIPALAAIDVLYEENKLLKDKIIRLEEVVYGN